MPYLILNREQVALADGQTTIGTSSDATLRLPDAGSPRVHAILDVARTRRVTIRPADGAALVHVNGAPLAARPFALSHGDRISVAGYELLYGEERKEGGTQHITPELAATLRSMAGATPATPAAGTGGVLACLLDGREYPVPQRGLLIGRDAACDVVVASNDVSRRHAIIVPGPRGYILTDTSTNGVFVNGERVTGKRVLCVGDQIRVGNETFSFRADAKG